jgi:hypothetical protein
VASAHEIGVDALNALKKEFENTNAVKEQVDLVLNSRTRKSEKMNLQQCGFQEL